MSPTSRKRSEADWDAWKSTVRRLFLREGLPVKSVLEHLHANDFDVTYVLFSLIFSTALLTPLV
ncbi:hypothetical protein ANO14919_089190 [Xylariales sp. No.14919]|nr:hypothetical protein ANO14919_089190 [Xylariales sp. No.14919]